MEHWGASPRVFISYSHDTNTHKERVLSLSERLRKDGIETSLDQYVRGTPAETWPRWMLNQIDWADFILLVCTETYYRRFRGHEEAGKGKGVDWESAVIAQKIYDARSATIKFVPVLFDTVDDCFIPEPVRGRAFYVLNSKQAYKNLSKFLLDQLGFEPGPVGEPKRKPRVRAKQLVFGAKAGSGAREGAGQNHDQGSAELLKKTLLYVGTQVGVNQGVVTTSQHHLGGTTKIIGYSIHDASVEPRGDFIEVFVGNAQGKNAGVVTPDTNHAGGSTESIGYLARKPIAGGVRLYAGEVSNCNDGVVTTSKNHLNCSTHFLGYTLPQ